MHPVELGGDLSLKVGGLRNAILDDTFFAFRSLDTVDG